jgi:hypothetical protein
MRMRPSFEARKSAHLRMTVALLETNYTNGPKL